MSAITLPPLLLFLPLIFDCQFHGSLQIQVQEMGPIPRKYNWGAWNLKFSYLTKQAKRKWRHAHATTRAILLDKPHVHFIAHHRHNDPQLLRKHLHATNLSRSISLQRLAIHTSGTVNSRSTLPLTVHTTIEHLPATSTPNLKHLLQRAWISVTVWKQKRDKELKLTQTQHQRSL